MRVEGILLAVVAAFALGACSSGDKKVEEAQSSAEKTVEKAGSAAKGAAADAKKDMKKAVDSGSAGPGVSMECTNGKDVRKLEVQATEGGKGCELVYTKNGDSSQVASSRYGSTHCEKVAERMKGNLEGAGFTCK